MILVAATYKNQFFSFNHIVIEAVTYAAKFDSHKLDQIDTSEIVELLSTEESKMLSTKIAYCY